MSDIKFNIKKPVWALLFMACFSYMSCTTLDLYEKNIPIPKHQWQSDFKPEFNFTIKDTLSEYQVFLVFRHTEKYNYKNLWIRFSLQAPGDTIRKSNFDLQLATNEKGWLATGMDDIYEHRLKLTNAVRLKAGEYTFWVENIMREDPLQHVLSVGIRVEKQQ